MYLCVIASTGYENSAVNKFILYSNMNSLSTEYSFFVSKDEGGGGG